MNPPRRSARWHRRHLATRKRRQIQNLKRIPDKVAMRVLEKEEARNKFWKWLLKMRNNPALDPYRGRYVDTTGRRRKV